MGFFARSLVGTVHECRECGDVKGQRRWLGKRKDLLGKIDWASLIKSRWGEIYGIGYYGQIIFLDSYQIYFIYMYVLEFHVGAFTKKKDYSLPFSPTPLG